MCLFVKQIICIATILNNYVNNTILYIGVGVLKRRAVNVSAEEDTGRKANKLWERGR